MKSKNRIQNKKLIWSGVLFFLTLCFIFLLVYKAQLSEKLNKPITCTLKSLHKENGTVTMSDDNPNLSQTFTCTVPSLSELRLECKVTGADSDTKLLMILQDADTGEDYYHGEYSLSRISGKSAAQKLSVHPAEAVTDSQGKTLRLSLHLLNGNGTSVELTGNTKQGIVKSFNDDESDKTNIIYDISYSDCSSLVNLYVALCSALLFFAAACFYLLMIRKMTLNEVFVPLAFVLGLILNFVIMVNGVPDEPAHLDTAYKYSDIILFTNTGNDGTIYKRQCDAEMMDMLVNGVENNSYYQLLNHFFETPANTELVEVTYLDAGRIVPGIVYIPAAIGISIGRLLGLSALFTLSLGRIMNLIVFIALTGMAIKLIPFGKDMLALAMLLPISLQQAASASYDAVINGVLVLYIALCFDLAYNHGIRRYKLVLLAILSIFIAMTKGGVYLPLCLLLIMVYRKNQKSGSPTGKPRLKGLFLAGCIISVLVVVLLIKYLLLFLPFLTDTAAQASDPDAAYTVSYFIQHPARLLYLYWNTFIRLGSDHLRGLLGGMLGWLDFKINWIYLILLNSGLFLLVNTDSSRYPGKSRDKLFLLLTSAASIVLIMLSMILSFTSAQLTYIDGLQGRYYLVLLPLILLTATTDMIHVNRKQCSSISMVMMSTEILIVLNMVAMV